MGHVYYVDNHSIFRFVQGRDSRWRKHNLLTDHADPQWKQGVQDLRVRVTYALSAQAKGKIERPYRWLQDRLVRTCAREHITRMEEAQQVLEQEDQRVLLGYDLVPEVFPVEAANKLPGTAETELLDNVPADFGDCSCSQRHDRNIRKIFLDLGKLPVFRPEIVTPFRNTMRFIDSDEPDPQTPE